MSEERALQEFAARLAAHDPIREGLIRILQGGEGALIVLGTNPALGSISVDGLNLSSASLNAARLAELAKMDGAIILDNAWKAILAANAHLAPPPDIPTTESGARHRTAQRVAQMTGLPVLTVSMDRGVATLYVNADQADLTPRWAKATQVQERLQLLFDLRDRFDQVEERLLRMELLGLVTAFDVANVLGMGEAVLRTGQSIKTAMVDTGQDPDLIAAQLHDRVSEVANLMAVTVSDYLGRAARTVRQKLADVPAHRLWDTWWLASELGLDQTERVFSPRGNRLLYHVGFWLDKLREPLLDAFSDAPSLLGATVEDLMEVKGIGEKKAARLRLVLDRLLATAHPIGQRTISEHPHVI